MAQIYTDECEHNIVRDCNNLFNVLKHLDVSSPKKDAESLKYLYKITMLIAYKQTSKLFPASQFSIKYICNHPILPITLVEIIKNSRNFKITVYCVEILFRLIIKNKLVPENDRRTIRKLFWDPQNFKNVLECIQCIYFYYKDDHTCTFNDILLKILKITNCLYMRKGTSQIVMISNFTIQFIGDLIIEYKTHKDIYQAILPIIKVLSKNKKNINLLISEQFFTCLTLLLPAANKIATVISILKLTSKSAEAVAIMSKCERLYSFILNTLSIPGDKAVYKKHLMAVLYKMTKTQFGINIINKPLYWNILLDFLSKNDRQEEQKFRLILIKGYTILYRGVNKIPYNIQKLNLNIKLPNEYQKDCLEHSDDSDNEMDESEDEDENNNRNIRERSQEQIYTSEEDDLSNDDDFDDNDSDTDDHHFDDLDETNNTDLFMVERCFQEFSCGDSERNRLKIYDGLRELINFRQGDNSTVRKVVENRVKRYENMNFLAFPDVVGAIDDSEEYLSSTINCFSSEAIIKKLKKAKGLVDDFPRKIIYDLDTLLFVPDSNRIDIPNPDTFKEECDFQNATKLESRYKIKPSKTSPTSLCFESRFESGNLRMAEQIGYNEYNLFLTPDVNSCGGLQWFYFQVSAMTADVKYTFNIINFQRVNSQFNYGMQPVMFSCTNFVINGIGWRKTGEQIIYFGNEYANSDDKQYRTLSFTVSFPYPSDYCYLAYHYPYTYSRLMMRLFPFTVQNQEVMYTRLDKLCTTLSGSNDVPLLTITGPTDTKRSTYVPIERRPLVFLTARVHPSESNASWIMDGILEFLLDEQDERAFIARNNYIFKIIPMLNPDGVMFGNTRCGLTGNDLNRCWKNPHSTLHPEIYYAKKLVQYAREELKNEILTFIDIHGHSRKKFFFFYGCNPKQSWNDNDKPLDESSGNSYLFIPRLLSTNVNMKTSFCRNTIERKRESTCRVVMWREFAIKCSYTLECSYCSGENKKKMTTKMLRDIGISIITSLASLPQLTKGK